MHVHTARPATNLWKKNLKRTVVGLRERLLLLFGRALDTFPGRVPLLVVESRLFGKILEGIDVLQRADKRDEENGSEDGSLAQERVVQVNKARIIMLLSCPPLPGTAMPTGL